MIVEKLRFPAGRPWSVPQLLANTRRLVRTHAFRLAAIYFFVFAASVLGVLLFVYWTSANFVEQQTEATLDAEITGLAEQYAQRGLSGLVQIIAARSAGDRGDGMLYLVTNKDGRPLAGNIADCGEPAEISMYLSPSKPMVRIRATESSRMRGAARPATLTRIEM